MFKQVDQQEWQMHDGCMAGDLHSAPNSMVAAPNDFHSSVKQGVLFGRTVKAGGGMVLQRYNCSDHKAQGGRR